jgi:cytochrome c oxidase cbb3-type subunit 3
MAGQRKLDEHTGIEDTGHEWDGIRELDRPLPRWWLWVFYASIAASVVMWILYPAWPLVKSYTPGILHASARADVARDLKALQDQRGAEAHMLDNASLEQIEKDPKMQAYALAVGQSIFGDNCAGCHGQGGTGGKGYPNLRDDIWLWGGSLEDIQHTITVGVRSGQDDARTSQMPAFGRDQMLKSDQVDDLTEYVVALSHRPADAAAVARAAPVFAQQCAACHGPMGTGNQAMGAPNLTDSDWLYGSDRGSIRSQIWNGRGGVMPSWRSRFSPSTIKALAVYIHANAGGQ